MNPDFSHLWNGHLDTVHYGYVDEWERNPSEPVIIEDRLYVCGASDIKSGLAGEKASFSIRFIGTCDERKCGQGALKIIENKRSGRPDLMITGESTHCDIGIAQKNCLWMKIIINGETSHGVYPEQDINAVKIAYKICIKFKKAVRQYAQSLLKNPSAEITSVTGGVASNMISDICILITDVRVVRGLNNKKTLNLLKQICDKYEARTEGPFKTGFSVLNERSAVSIEADNKYALLLKELIGRYGMIPEIIDINHFTDALIFKSGYPDMSVLLFGPGSPNAAYKPDEDVDIEKYYLTVYVLRDLYNIGGNFR